MKAPADRIKEIEAELHELESRRQGLLVEMRSGGVFVQAAEAMPVRDIPIETINEWIA